jgi:hypothetical protein
MRVAETDLPPRPLDRSPEPAAIADDFATEQVAYVDEVDGAAPQIPMDEQGSVLAGSGVSSDHLARNDARTDDVTAPAAPPRAPAMPASAPLPQQPDMPRQEEANRIASPQNYPPRSSVQQTYDARRPPEDTFYGALPDQMRQAQMRQEQMREEEPRQQPRQEPPSYYRPWQPVRPTPYQTYLDQPPREAQGYPAQRQYDPPSYQPAPPTYYRSPYEDPRAR